ncbi:unnamed protein product [Rotaria sordida]|uniref:Uncharacterized protein n=1 Tax=Rotaria sordida TaxID=392033 RepID=A0A816BHM4_9BILA|nr:unnamed protein product [Rotaria sordida]CAF1609324.1 unnamed protein product [Rotaria sordida]
MSFKKSKWHCPFKLTRRTLTLEQENLLEYQPKTLNKHNEWRRQFLPMFPKLSNQHTQNVPLLLASVPAEKLSVIELLRRSPGIHPDPWNSKYDTQNSSYVYLLYGNLLNPLKTRFNVDTSILDYNLYRLHHIIELFINKYRTYEGSDFLFDHHFQVPGHDKFLRRLHTNELIMFLEFFLQIDVDTFFMKTCTFRITDGLFIKSGLFCTEEITNTLGHDMKPCQQLFCTLCQAEDDSDSTSCTTIKFSTSGQKHRFVNGYEAILNCPANCQTNNIIYVLTCVCGEYDYIGSTQYTLNEVIEYHRHHSNRLIIEYLLNGEPFLVPCICTQNELNKQRANKQRLYQHFTHCTKALQLFLQYNPEYWPFVPMKVADAQFDDLSYKNMADDNITEDSINIQNVYPTNVPKPPAGYTFSQRQLAEQRQFFTNFHPRHYQFYSTLDLYRATIVAVLPFPCSIMFRHLIEILFVTHAETKLNCYNLFTSATDLLYGLPYSQGRIWCENLLNPSVARFFPSNDTTTFIKTEK